MTKFNIKRPKKMNKILSKIANPKKKTPKQSAIEAGKEVIKDLEERGFFLG